MNVFVGQYKGKLLSEENFRDEEEEKHAEKVIENPKPEAKTTLKSKEEERSNPSARKMQR